MEAGQTITHLCRWQAHAPVQIRLPELTHLSAGPADTPGEQAGTPTCPLPRLQKVPGSALKFPDVRLGLNFHVWLKMH